MLLEGKKAIVTGASQGIGKSIALILAREGADVAVCDLQEEKVKMVAEEIVAMGRQSLGLKTDVTIKTQVDSMVEKLIQKFGQINILVNNAGICLLDEVIHMSEEDWDATLDVNTKGVFLCSQRAAQEMVKQGAGRIINIASNCGSVPRVEMGAYCASKAGVILLTRVMALELAKYGILVNAVCPGSTASEMQKKMQKKTGMLGKIIKGDLDTFRAGIPMGKLGRPEDQAEMVVFLASDKAKHITGQCLYVDGGQTMF